MVMLRLQHEAPETRLVHEAEIEAILTEPEAPATPRAERETT